MITTTHAPARGRFFGEGVDGRSERWVQPMRVYRVEADRVTGEWLTVQPRPWTVERAEWAQRQDHEHAAFDFAEIDGRTVAVWIEWVD